MIIKKLKTILMALMLRGGSMVIQFVSTLLLVRVLGPSGMGIYSLYTSWMQVLSSIGGVGSTTFTLRTVAVLEKKKDIAQIGVYLWKISCLVIVGGTLLAVPMLIWPEVLSAMVLGDDAPYYILIFAAGSGVVFSLLKIFSEGLKSLRRINTALSIESALVATLLVCVAGLILMNQWTVTVEWIVAIHLMILMVAGAVALYCLLIAKNSFSHQAATEKIAVPNRSLLPMWGSSLLGMGFINMPILLLPQFSTTDELGIFSMAYRLILIVVNILMVLAAIYGPKFASAYASHDVAQLKRDLRQTQLWSIILYAPLFLLFFFAAEFTMSIFGSEFRTGGVFLWVMALGQLIYASTGLVGFMMNMIHREREEFLIMLLSSLLMLAMILILGHRYGAVGVAAGFGAGLAVKNLISFFMVHGYLKKLSIQG